jgi:hypothetical protein
VEVAGYGAAPTKGAGQGGRRVRCGATGLGAGWARWRQGVGGGTQPRAVAGIEIRALERVEEGACGM